MIKAFVILLEIILCIVLPLFLFYGEGKRSERNVTLSLTLLPILWYFTNSPLHEFGHMIATYLVGGTVSEVLLFPKFWEGSFGNAYIHSEGVHGNLNFAITSLFPYFIDILFLLVGYYIYRKCNIKGVFTAGFILMLFFLRPLFDILSNTTCAVFFRAGDFYQLTDNIGILPTIAIGVTLSGIAIYLVFIVLKRSSYS